MRLIGPGVIRQPHVAQSKVTRLGSSIRLEGASLVDLHLSGALINLQPDWFSADGFHPNGKGYAVIAGLFEAAYRNQA